MRLYVSGHAATKGYVIEVTYSDDEILAMPPITRPEPPVRIIPTRRAFAIVERFNRRYATH